MEQYINKASVIEEIERRIKKYTTIDVGDCKELEAIYGAKCKALTEILSSLNTLEVKEDNLETLLQSLPEKIYDENSHQVYEMSVYHFDGQCVVDYVGEIEHDSLCSFAGDTFYEAAESAWEYLRKDSLGS